MNRDDEGTAWERGWDGHQERQLRRLAKVPLADKLRWLDEAHHLVQHLTRASAEEVKSKELEKSKVESQKDID